MPPASGLRFAFYGRVSTEDHQDPATSRAWQLLGGVCGRRMESHWSHRHPGYRCRHGHTSATRPEPGRTPNTYLREDQVLPNLPALHLRLTSQLDLLRPVSRASVRPTPDQAIAHLRSEAISLTYDAATRTLTADAPQTERITIS